MTALVPVVLAPATINRQADSDSELIELWLNGRTAHTQVAYRKDVARFDAFMGKPLAQVTLREFQAFTDGLTGAVASKRRIIGALKSLFTFASKIGYLVFNVAAAVRAPKSPNTLAERILPEAGVQRMIALASNRRDQMLLRLLYASGVRVSELCGLKWRNCQQNGESGQITVLGKGGKVRSIVLPVGLWKDLMELRGEAGDDAPVFASRKAAGHLTTVQVLRIVRNAATKAGIKAHVSPHWLRHCHASHALERGAALNLVQVTLGHSNLSVTGAYLHARPNDSSARYLAV
jgi:integrase/recombinase XerD